MVMSWINAFPDAPAEVIAGHKKIVQQMAESELLEEQARVLKLRAESLRAQAYHGAIDVEVKVRCVYGEEAVRDAKAGREVTYITA